MTATLGIDAGVKAMSATRDARPLSAHAVESAIRQLAAAGRPFSANDARAIHGVRGGVVGATFNALRAEGVIRPIGSETSTDRGTHGKPVARWVGAPLTPGPEACGEAADGPGHTSEPSFLRLGGAPEGAATAAASRPPARRMYGRHDEASAPTTSTIRCGGKSSFCSQPKCRAEHEVPRPAVLVEQRRVINEKAAA